MDTDASTISAQLAQMNISVDQNATILQQQHPLQTPLSRCWPSVPQEAQENEAIMLQNAFRDCQGAYTLPNTGRVESIHNFIPHVFEPHSQGSHQSQPIPQEPTTVQSWTYPLMPQRQARWGIAWNVWLLSSWAFRDFL
jgi:hypothetical protein